MADISNDTVNVWTSGTTRTMKERGKYQAHILDFCTPGFSIDNTAGILAWAAEAQANRIPMVMGGYGAEGVFNTTREIEIYTPGQVVRNEDTGGSIYRGADTTSPIREFNSAANKGARLVAIGSWFGSTGKRVRTRRLHRANAGSPKDAALSCLMNIQAEGVHLDNMAFGLEWSGADFVGGVPNLGTYCDVAVFVGCRAHTQLNNLQALGYFRRAGVYHDVTQASNLPTHASVSDGPLAGANYPASTFIGGDGSHMYNPTIMGGRVGLANLGAKPAAGNDDYGPQYYDEATGLVNDQRGTAGFSDFLVTGGRIYGPDHHTKWRMADPSASTLSETSLNNEPDNSPAAVHIDGLAGNASTSLWGMRFLGTRMSTYEMFRLRLGKTSRIQLLGCHIEGRSSAAIKKSNGAALPSNDTNDYEHNTYGSISGTAQTSYTTVFGTPSQTPDGYVPHYYGPTGVTFHTDSGRIYLGKAGYISSQKGELDMRAEETFGHRWRSGSVSKMTLDKDGNLRVYGNLQVDGSIGGAPTGDTVIVRHTAVQIADKNHAVNTVGKTQGKLIVDTTNWRLMIAAGAGATSTWRIADGSGSVTPS